MSLLPPIETVGKLQTALQTKAKAEPQYRFYAWYDKVHRADVLSIAYERCRANKGVAGVDGQTFDDIQKYGVVEWLRELMEDLKNKTYQASPVLRVWIPKEDGKQRPLGIPTIRDRVVQTAAMLVLEPIFEADLQPEQHAYRSGKSALDAVKAVGRRGLERVFRQHSAPRTEAVRGSAGQRSVHAPAHYPMAGSSG
jgi:RNA-directed DNA polymerase